MQSARIISGLFQRWCILNRHYKKVKSYTVKSLIPHFSV